MTIIKYLQKNIKHIRMSLFNLVKKNDTVWISAHFFAELSTFFIAYISGGDPIILETLCFSIYSDISTRIIACSLPNTASASALESSVFPTPVGPRNKKEPIGLAGSFNPTLPLLPHGQLQKLPHPVRSHVFSEPFPNLQAYGIPPLSDAVQVFLSSQTQYRQLPLHQL